MKILSIPQVQAADQYTIEHEPISSLNLMERAATALFAWCQKHISLDQNIAIVCGPGNNGGDGLALARLLWENGYKHLNVLYVKEEGSPDFTANWKRLPKGISTFSLAEDAYQADLSNADYLIDALFGSGLRRLPEGQYAEWIQEMNASSAIKVAIDLPSGLLGDAWDKIIPELVFKADYTLSFQLPKKSLVHPISCHLAGKLEVLDIGLHPQFLASAPSDWHWLTEREVGQFFKQRKKHSYKGDYGHALFLAGSESTLGAALIAAEAGLRSGLGLLHVNLPDAAFSAINTRLPEAMVQKRDFQSLPDLQRYNAILLGPGLGRDSQTAEFIRGVLEKSRRNLILDADALYHLSEHPEWFSHLPKGTLLTPHPGEYRRILGVEVLGSDQLERGLQLAKEHQIYILLKGSISTLLSPDGSLHFYDFGSSALAKGGSGDLLAGLISGFIAQAYSVEEAVAICVYLQGKAARLAEAKIGSPAAVLSSDILKEIGAAFPADL